MAGGFSFGAEFISPFYQPHPNPELYTICLRSAKGLTEGGGRHKGRASGLFLQTFYK
jgi:hypothetical protein